jgi:hypothetical protein
MVTEIGTDGNAMEVSGERPAQDLYAGQFIRADGMVQSGPDPDNDTGRQICPLPDSTGITGRAAISGPGDAEEQA